MIQLLAIFSLVVTVGDLRAESHSLNRGLFGVGPLQPQQQQQQQQQFAPPPQQQGQNTNYQQRFKAGDPKQDLEKIADKYDKEGKDQLKDFKSGTEKILQSPLLKDAAKVNVENEQLTQKQFDNLDKLREEISTAKPIGEKTVKSIEETVINTSDINTIRAQYAKEAMAPKAQQKSPSEAPITLRERLNEYHSQRGQGISSGSSNPLEQAINSINPNAAVPSINGGISSPGSNLSGQTSVPPEIEGHEHGFTSRRASDRLLDSATH